MCGRGSDQEEAMTIEVVLPTGTASAAFAEMRRSIGGLSHLHLFPLPLLLPAQPLDTIPIPRYGTG